MEQTLRNFFYLIDENTQYFDSKALAQFQQFLAIVRGISCVICVDVTYLEYSMLVLNITVNWPNLILSLFGQKSTLTIKHFLANSSI